MADNTIESMQIEDGTIDLSEKRKTVGTVQLLDQDQIILIPRPTNDPRDPLTRSAWRKWIFIFAVGSYCGLTNLITTGMGAIWPTVLKAYPGQEDLANDLNTFPTLMMGIGNLIAMPLAYAVGRRPVFLGVLVVMLVSGVWCALSQSLRSHIAGRNIMSMAAGQAEALAPMMISEIFYLHERGRMLGWLIAIQAVDSGLLMLSTTSLVAVRGWRWFYGLFVIVNGLVLILSIFFVYETDFVRPENDGSDGAADLGKNIEHTDEERHETVPEEDNWATHLSTVHPSRTWRDDLRLFSHKPQWKNSPIFFKQLLQSICVPSMLWLLMLNGSFLGTFVFQSSTFGTILETKPWNFDTFELGYVQTCQIVVIAVFLPLLGYGGDLLIKLVSKFRRGIYEPEYRLIPLIVPVVVGVACIIMYGRLATHTEGTSWVSIVATFYGVFFAFLGCNIAGLTYAADSFPTHRGVLMVVICSGRGFISFGLSYSVLPAVSKLGYNGSANVYGIACGILAALGVPVFIYGRSIRQFAQRRIIRF